MDKAMLYLVICVAYSAGAVHTLWAIKDKDNSCGALRIIFMGVSLFLLHKVALGLFNG